MPDFIEALKGEVIAEESPKGKGEIKSCRYLQEEDSSQPQMLKGLITLGSVCLAAPKH